MILTEDFKHFCAQLEFDLKPLDYKEKLIDWQKLDNILIYGLTGKPVVLKLMRLEIWFFL